MKHQKRRSRGFTRGLLSIAASSAILVAIGCSSSSSSNAEGGGDAAGADVSSLHIGFSNPTAENTYLGPLGEALGKTVEAAGAQYTEISAQVNPDKQISDIQTLIASGVDVLIVYPLDAKALMPVIEQAADQGITVLGFNADLEAEIGEAPAAPYVGQLFDGYPSPILAKDQGAWVKENIGSGEVMFVGLGVPVPALDLFANNVGASLEAIEGIDYVGRVDSASDDTAAAVEAVSAALTRFPNLKGIVTTSDAHALGAAQALKSVGRDGDVLIASSQLQDPGWPAIEDGSIAVSWDFQNILLGTTLGEMALAAGEGSDESKYATTIQPGIAKVDKSNIGSHIGWQEQLDALG